MVDLSSSYHEVDISSSYDAVDKSVVFAFLFIPIVFDAHVGRLDPLLSARKDSVQQCVYVRSDNTLSMLTKKCVFFHLDKSEGSVFMCRVEPLDRRDHTAVVYLAVEENLG